MKALVFNGPRDIRYERFDDPELKSPNSAILKVNKCSICGSDLHIYHGDTIAKHDYQTKKEKFCVGHEFTGEIVETGPDVHKFRVGDKVLSSGGTGCGTCSYCRSGRWSLCRSSSAFGVHAGLNGGQAEYVCVPNADQILHKIEDGITDEQAILLTDAMATAYFGITRTSVQPGDKVTVVGLGPIGLIGVELAYLFGASEVYALDPVAGRRRHAEKLGAIAFDPLNDGVAEIVEESRGGTHRVFEASGADAAIASTLDVVKYKGSISFVGLPQKSAALSFKPLLFKDVTVRAGVADPSATWATLVPLLQSGRLTAEDLFSHTMSLSEGAEAYRLFDARDDDVIKIMLDV